MTVIWATLHHPPLLLLLLPLRPMLLVSMPGLQLASGQAAFASARLIAILAAKPTACNIRVVDSFSENSFSHVSIPDNSK